MIAGRFSIRTVSIAAAGLTVLAVFTVLIIASSGVRLTYTLRTVTAGGLLLGAVSGAIGSFVVLRNQSLLGDAISHAALPGVGIGFLIAGRSLGALLFGAATASLLGVWFISFVTRNSRIKQDSAMGIVLAGWFAVGIGVLTFIQQRPDAGQAGLSTFIFGEAAAMVKGDVRILALVGSGVVVLLLLFWKEFKLVTFDPDFARANGYRVRTITGLLLLLVVATIVIGLQLAGVVLMVGLLIAPGVAARQWTGRLEAMVVLAALIGAVSGGAGAVVSALDADLPTGPMIILIASVFVASSLLFAPGRGVIWEVLRRRRDRQVPENDNGRY
ncbi:MAG: metal ABC transporter permease [Alkalispirochaeta sp.]